MTAYTRIVLLERGDFAGPITYGGAFAHRPESPPAEVPPLPPQEVPAPPPPGYIPNPGPPPTPQTPPQPPNRPVGFGQVLMLTRRWD